MSSPFAEAEEVRRRITIEHAVLRSLSQALVTAIDAAVIEGRDRPLVRVLLEQLCDEIELHLQYEEAALVPVLHRADAWGPVRADELAREHDEQRRTIAALLEKTTTSPDVRALAAELALFLEQLERDMVEEERDLLTAEALGERVIVVDQTGG